MCWQRRRNPTDAPEDLEVPEEELLQMQEEVNSDEEVEDWIQQLRAAAAEDAGSDMDPDYEMASEEEDDDEMLEDGLPADTEDIEVAMARFEEWRSDFAGRRRAQARRQAMENGGGNIPAGGAEPQQFNAVYDMWRTNLIADNLGNVAEGEAATTSTNTAAEAKKEEVTKEDIPGALADDEDSDDEEFEGGLPDDPVEAAKVLSEFEVWRKEFTARRIIRAQKIFAEEHGEEWDGGNIPEGGVDPLYFSRVFNEWRVNFMAKRAARLQALGIDPNGREHKCSCCEEAAGEQVAAAEE